MAARRVDDSGGSGGEGAEGIGGDLDPDDGQAGVGGGPFVFSNGPRVAAKEGVFQQDMEEDSGGDPKTDHEGLPREGDREVGGKVLAESEVDVVVLGAPPRQTADPDHRGERHDEGLNAEAGDQASVENAQNRRGGEGRGERRRQVQGRGAARLPSDQKERQKGGGKGEHAADRKIDSAGDDHEGHRQRDDADFGLLPENVGEVLGIEKDDRPVRGAGAQADGEEDDEGKTENALQAAKAGKRGREGEFHRKKSAINRRNRRPKP